MVTSSSPPPVSTPTSWITTAANTDQLDYYGSIQNATENRITVNPSQE